MQGRTPRPAELARRLEHITRDMSRCFDQLSTAILTPDPRERRAEVSVLAARIGRDCERIARSLGALAEEAEPLLAAVGGATPARGSVDGGCVGSPVELRLVPQPDGQPALDDPSEIG